MKTKYVAVWQQCSKSQVSETAQAFWTLNTSRHTVPVYITIFKSKVVIPFIILNWDNGIDVYTDWNR